MSAPADDLKQAVDALETVEWREVPGVEPATVAPVAQALQRTLDELQGAGDTHRRRAD